MLNITKKEIAETILKELHKYNLLEDAYITYNGVRILYEVDGVHICGADPSTLLRVEIGPNLIDFLNAHQEKLPESVENYIAKEGVFYTSDLGYELEFFRKEAGIHIQDVVLDNEEKCFFFTIEEIWDRLVPNGLEADLYFCYKNKLMYLEGHVSEDNTLEQLEELLIGVGCRNFYIMQK